MTPPRWLFFPTQSSDPQYIYEVQTDRSVVRGSPQPDKRKQDSTGTESGSLSDQFAPLSASNQFEKASDSIIRFKVNNSDTSSSEYGTKTLIGNNITSASMTVGSSTFTADSISIGGTNTRPRFDLTSSDSSAGLFWTNNNLDDTDDITITVTLTF
jgi:hypothetical protein